MSLPQLQALAVLQGSLGVPVQVGGSFARGKADELSDLDLAFEPGPEWSVDSRGGLMVAVKEVALARARSSMELRATAPWWISFQVPRCRDPVRTTSSPRPPLPSSS